MKGLLIQGSAVAAVPGRQAVCCAQAERVGDRRLVTSRKMLML